MNTKPNEYISADEYELLQNEFPCKSEFSDGAIIMHSDISERHNYISNGIVAHLYMYFKKTNCNVYSDGIEVIFDEKHKFKPDVFVMCDNYKDTMKGQSFTTAPKIIFEVISKSTASHDRITKLQIYRKYGVLEYNMIEQDGTFIQCTLIDDEYHVREYSNDDTYTSSVFNDFKINLNDIF